MQWRTFPWNYFCESQQDFCSMSDPLAQLDTYDLDLLDQDLCPIVCLEEANISSW